MKRRWATITIGLLLGTNLLTAGLAGWYAYGYWARGIQMRGHAAHAGEVMAIEDLSADRQRLFHAVSALGSDGVVFTGRTDRETELEIWHWPAVMEPGNEPSPQTQAFIKGYNTRMRFMVTYPDVFMPNYDHYSVAPQPVSAKSSAR